MSDAAPTNRKWKIALVATIVVVPLLSTLGAAWASHNFPDVPPSNIFHGQIGWASQHKVVNGYTNGNFGPNDPVNRGQAATFMSNYNDAIHIVTMTHSPPNAASWLVDAVCPVGERAIGGIANHPFTNTFLADTFMSGRTFQARFEAENDEVFDPGTIQVKVVCAPDSLAHPGTSLDEDAPVVEQTP